MRVTFWSRCGRVLAAVCCVGITECVLVQIAFFYVLSVCVLYVLCAFGSVLYVLRFEKNCILATQMNNEHIFK